MQGYVIATFGVLCHCVMLMSLCHAGLRHCYIWCVGSSQGSAAWTTVSSQRLSGDKPHFGPAELSCLVCILVLL